MDDEVTNPQEIRAEDNAENEELIDVSDEASDAQESSNNSYEESPDISAGVEDAAENAEPSVTSGSGEYLDLSSELDEDADDDAADEASNDTPDEAITDVDDASAEDDAAGDDDVAKDVDLAEDDSGSADDDGIVQEPDESPSDIDEGDETVSVAAVVIAASDEEESGEITEEDEESQGPAGEDGTLSVDLSDDSPEDTVEERGVFKNAIQNTTTGQWVVLAILLILDIVTLAFAVLLWTGQLSI